MNSQNLLRKLCFKKKTNFLHSNLAGLLPISNTNTMKEAAVPWHRTEGQDVVHERREALQSKRPFQSEAERGHPQQ